MRHSAINLFAILLFCFIAAPVFSDNLVYQWQEFNRTFFSDRPHPHARVIALPEQRHAYRVKRVIDGDTVLLDDGTKVRLLGINTPEMGKRYQTAEAGGKRAKQWLANELTGQTVRLETDTEKTDKYGRTLAHIFTDANVHINVQLVQRGLATVSLYPPNLKYASQLIAAQTLAEKQGLGIWSDPAYAIKTLKQLNPDNQQGWQRLSGTVLRVRQTRRYYYLEFSDNFKVRILRANAGLFPDFNAYIGHTVEIRGWLNHQQGQLSMLIRHPDAIRL